MKEVSQKNFGPLVAYVVPGLVVLLGVSDHSITVRTWLTSAEGSSPSVAGFLYVTLASLAAGLTLNAIRSVTLDVFHHRTGVKAPELDFSDFQAKFWAFNQLVESHYRYYQFYSHMAIALLFVFCSWMSAEVGGAHQVWLGLIVGALALILLASSRNALNEYYTRARQLLGTQEPRKRNG